MLEDLPESFILQLANIDPVVGMISKKLHESCGGSRIDAWKFMTSPARFNFLRSNLIDYGNAMRGIKSIMSVKAASGDIAFMNMGYHSETYSCSQKIMQQHTRRHYFKTPKF